MEHVITVLGCGSWGGTMAVQLADLGHKVTCWHKFPEEIKEMEKTRNHPLVPGLRFPEKVSFTSDFSRAIPGATIIIVAVPSHIVRHVIPEILDYLSIDAIFVNLSKGIENDSLMTMSQVIRSVGNVSGNRVVTLYGPSHAEEVAKKIPTTLVSACSDLENAKIIQGLFSSETLRLYINHDILGVELGGSLKNVIAIAAGICDGIGFGDNTKAALLTRGIAEMTRLGTVLGADRMTFSGLSGIGDLIATCLSRHSRNRYVGEEIGKGRQMEDILGSMKMVAEGVKTTKSVKQLADKHGVDMPISSAVYNIIFKGQNPMEAVNNLMTRQLIHETEE